MTSTMNRQLGTKWFTFYTKVRPWFSVVGALLLALNARVYMNDWYLLLDFIGAVVNAVLAVIVWVKSSGDYGEFVTFVEGVLIFECISMAYSASIDEYGLNEFTFLVCILLSYFVWYRLNIKYFKKRWQFTVE